MRKIKKRRGGRESERDGRNGGEEGKGDERGSKTSRDIFRRELGRPKRPVEFYTMAFRATVKRATYTVHGSGIPILPYDLLFFLFLVLGPRVNFNFIYVTLRMTRRYQ